MLNAYRYKRRRAFLSAHKWVGIALFIVMSRVVTGYTHLWVVHRVVAVLTPTNTFPAAGPPNLPLAVRVAELLVRIFRSKWAGDED